MSGIGQMISGGLSTLAGIGTSIAGGVKRKRAKEDMDELQENRPQFEIPQEYLANLSQAERMALQGLPEAQKMAYVQQQERNQANQLRAVSQGGNASRNISSIQQANQDSNLKMLAMDSQARMMNMQDLMNQRTTLAQEKEKQWNINEYQPYVQEYNQLSADILGASQMRNQGINAVMQGVSSIGEGVNQYYNPQVQSLSGK